MRQGPWPEFLRSEEFGDKIGALAIYELFWNRSTRSP
jgi:hypothetical protein